LNLAPMDIGVKDLNHEPFDRLRTCYSNYTKKFSILGFSWIG